MDFLNELFGISKLTVYGSEYKDSTLVLKARQNQEINHCPICNCKRILRNGKRTRRYRSLPVGRQDVFVDVDLQRYRCSQCGFDRQEPIDFAPSGRHYTNAFASYVLELLKLGTIQDVALHLGVSWDVVKEIHKRHLKMHYNHPNIQHVRYIGIDEFAVQKGHVYKTIVVDMDSGRIIYVGEGKGADSLIGFWNEVKMQHASIQAVSSDLSAAYLSAVATNAPQAIHVFDHFHVVKLMNDAVDEVRRAACREEIDLNKRHVIKGMRWLLLQNGRDIMDSRHRTRIDNALALNKPLATAYYLKESLRLIWPQRSKQDAENALLDWVQQARDSGVQPLIKVANSIMGYRTGILAWYDVRLSNGKVEGINNKIKVMKRDAYGFRDDEYFRLRLLSLHDVRITLKIG
jgi:transposase